LPASREVYMSALLIRLLSFYIYVTGGAGVLHRQEHHFLCFLR
jgi:hypothetical protein